MAKPSPGFNNLKAYVFVWSVSVKSLQLNCFMKHLVIKLIKFKQILRILFKKSNT